MTRDELDTLIDAAIMGLIGGVDPASDDAVAVREEAQLLEAEARSFADAVDRDGKRIDYGAAVVLEGPNGIAVVDAAAFHSTPLYWRTVVGRPDRITEGTALLPALQATANRAAPSAP